VRSLITLKQQWLKCRSAHEIKPIDGKPILASGGKASDEGSKGKQSSLLKLEIFNK